MEKEYQVSWFKVILVSLIIVGIVIILFLVYPKGGNASSNNPSSYIDNITRMKEVGFEYFKEANLPENIGESKAITLDEMLANNMIIQFNDENGNACDVYKSYVEVTKSLENEYNMKVALDCSDKADYIVATIYSDKVYQTKAKDSNQVLANNIPNTVNTNVIPMASYSNNINNNYVPTTYASGTPANNNVSNNGYSNSGNTNGSIINSIIYNINYINSCGICTGVQCPTNSCMSNIYYTVEFDAAGGSPVATQTVKQGAYAEYRISVRDGYDFLGWYLDGVKYDFATPVYRRLLLVAKWQKREEPKPTEYIVTFNSNGGTPVDPQVIIEGNLASRPADPTRQCYRFEGWYIDPYFTRKYDFNNRIYSNLTLYAKWVSDGSCDARYYSVTYVTNGGSSVPNEYNIPEGNYPTKPNDPTKKCYKFDGWYTDTAFTNRYTFNERMTKDITLYAKWVSDGSCDARYYSVTYVTNGGSSVPNEYNIPEGNYPTKPNDPTKKCYKFDGWYTDTAFTNRYSFNERMTKDITLYAKWVSDGSCDARYYSVTYVTNGGSSVPNEYNIPEGSYAKKPNDPTKSCYDFDGWYTDTAFRNRYNFNERMTKDITLYAKWIENDSCRAKYTVSFDSNGGSYVAPQTGILEGGYASRPVDPTRSGYRFLGWYYNGSPFNFYTAIYRNYTLVAQWEREQVQYNTYCKINTERYYSTGYVSSGVPKSYNWTIKFDNIRSDNLTITNVGYLNTDTLYNEAYNRYVTSKGLSMASGGNLKYEVPITSGYMLKTYALKSANFTKNLSAPYQSGGYWYTNVSVYVSNFNNTSKYYASNVGGYINYIPFYFDVRYVDKNNCVDDTTDNAYKYNGSYEVIRTYYR